MRTICKYQVLANNTPVDIEMPFDAVILHGDYQTGEFYIWAEIDTDNESTIRRILFCSTGRELPDNAWYVNSFLVPDLTLVFHVYELTETDPE